MTIWREFLLLIALSLAVLAAEETAAEELPKDVAEGRARKRFYKFLFKSLTPILSALSTILLVKFKVVLVGLFLAGIYFFGHKIWPGGFCGHSIISDVPPPFYGEGITGYHGSGPDILSSYPGPEPWSVPGSSYPGSLYPGSSYSSYPGSYSPSNDYPPSNAYLPPTGSPSPASVANRKTSRGRRDVDNAEDEELLDNEIYWTDQLTDMAFRFLGVTTKSCRKRFVCEFDFQARRNPILLFATRAMGRDIFHNYREAGNERAKDYADCGRIYADCAVPKRTVQRPNRRKGLRPTTTTTTTEEPETATEDESASAEQDAETINEIKNSISSDDDDVNTERSFGMGLQTPWRPVTSDPLGKLILRRSSSQLNRMRGN